MIGRSDCHITKEAKQLEVEEERKYTSTNHWEENREKEFKEIRDRETPR